ncbi:MAG: transcription antitermination factor NusB [Myxococcales bacterium]|nr:transcription antitermination factor NusB [Myxococcales bacterium]
MGARTSGRAVTLHVLFALDEGMDASAKTDAASQVGVVVVPDGDAALQKYFRSFEDPEVHEEGVEPDARSFAETMVRELVGVLPRVDEAIRKASANWRIERMPRVDRNIVRIGAFELLERKSTPRAVVIDEAVELAKRFGGDDSPRFVNGILERIADESGRPREDRKSRRPPPR